jgi:hypothetical protein
VNSALLDAIQLALTGQPELARERLSELWATIPLEDSFHRCVLAHYMADLQTDPNDELHWDQLALAAALAASPESFAEHLPDVTREAFLPSLHLNLASSYERTDALDLARQHAELALAATASLPATPLGQTTRQPSSELRPGLAFILDLADAVSGGFAGL